jgi:hypothetical protein
MANPLAKRHLRRPQALHLILYCHDHPFIHTMTVDAHIGQLSRPPAPATAPAHANAVGAGAG